MSDWDDSTTVITFGQQTGTIAKPVVNLKVGTSYKIEVERYVTNPPPTFTLAESWNNGTVPPEQVMYVAVLKSMGKMIYISGKGVTTMESWEGWIPQGAIKSFEEF